MTYTKLPWHVVKARRRRTLEILPEHDVATSCGIANVWSTTDEEDDPEMIANARFIVTACNSHDELLAACKSALNFIEMNGDVVAKGELTVKATLRAAIAKAEGGA